jgi:hypothetical protein
MGATRFERARSARTNRSQTGCVYQVSPRPHPSSPDGLCCLRLFLNRVDKAYQPAQRVGHLWTGRFSTCKNCPSCREFWEKLGVCVGRGCGLIRRYERGFLLKIHTLLDQRPHLWVSVHRFRPLGRRLGLMMTPGCKPFSSHSYSHPITTDNRVKRNLGTPQPQDFPGSSPLLTLLPQ